MISIVFHTEFLETRHFIADLASPPKRQFAANEFSVMVKGELWKVRVKLSYFRYNTRVRMLTVHGKVGPV